MDLIVRAVDVGFGNTKFVTGVGAGGDIRCASFPSRAYPSPRDPAKALGGEGRKTFAIPLGGLYYEVGPDVMLAADAFRATEIHGDYIETPQYLTLARGALRMMKVEAIDLLVVGLPVAAFAAKRGALEKLMTGRHDVGGGKTVVVHKTLAMAQPNGALIDYATQHDQVEAMEHEQSLVIDPGSRTFDWLIARGMKLSSKQSYSVDRGVSNILQLVADDISQEIGQPYTNLDLIDWALRSGKALTVYQRQYNPARMRPMVEIIARDAVAAMMRRIGGAFNVQHVILVGGGAFLFRKAVKQAFSTHQILEVKDPMFANVRGYQIAGMNYAQSVLASASRPRAAATEGERS
ncbi:PRTRC system protein D [Roseateles chitinivorans]|uniref:PRTRC system protein D n=1 Tax=Roseateles chitinivorans TaxID=2917965 RepID=UPI003D66B4C2